MHITPALRKNREENHTSSSLTTVHTSSVHTIRVNTNNVYTTKVYTTRVHTPVYTQRGYTLEKKYMAEGTGTCILIYYTTHECIKSCGNIIFIFLFVS